MITSIQTFSDMSQFNALSNNLKRRVIRQAEILLDTRLQQMAIMAINKIRRDSRRIVPDKKGTILGGLWRGNVATNGSKKEIEFGWSDPLGHFFEFGTEKKKWFVKPKGIKSDGKAVKALRFVSGGSVFYSKGHWIKFSEKMLKPHVKPVLDALNPMWPAAMRGIMSKAIELGTRRK